MRLAETTGELGARARRDRERCARRWNEARAGARAAGEHFDTLTGLPDGERLERALESALVTASETSQVAVALFDIEHLVVVNSRLGPRARELRPAAGRAAADRRPALGGGAARRAPGPRCRWRRGVGGGLFAAMLTGVPGWQEARATVRLLLDRVSGRYFARDEEIVLSASVGVALAPADGLTAEALIQKAELAASEAVESGGAIRFYGQSSRRVTERSRAITRLLANALARGELSSPLPAPGRGPGLADLRRGGAAPLGVARAGLDPARRVRAPGRGDGPHGAHRDLGAADGLRAGPRLDRRAACRPRASRSTSRCASSSAATSRRSCATAWRRRASTPSLLELELSERGVLRSDPDILRQLHAIRELGVRLAIDDFGTGNSAVVYLKQFPIDVLKIDQSFVRGVASSSEDAAITSATIAMARQLGLRVVAEGVEEQGQMDFLLRYGCSEYQGFLFSPAVPADAFAELLRSGIGTTPRVMTRS